MPLEALNEKQIEELIKMLEIVHKTAKKGISDILRCLNRTPLTILKPEDIEKINNWYTELHDLEKSDKFKAGKCLTNIILGNIVKRTNGRPDLMKELNIQP